MQQVNTPPDILAALMDGSPVVLSVSGGKDSEAMTKAVLSYLATHQLTNRVYMVHADLGRMEWAETPEYMQTMSRRYNVPLHIVSRDHDLLEGIERRAEKLAGQNKPAFPSSAARYCTAGWKRTVINSWLGHTFNRDTTVVQCIGLRRDESKARSKTPDSCNNELASAPTKGRNVLNWYPIAAWSTVEVWESLGVSPERLAEVQAAPNGSEWAYHPAYAYGNSRLSCALCVLADKTDLTNGATHNPELFRALVDIEIKTGFAFQKGKPLYDLVPELLTDGQRAALEG